MQNHEGLLVAIGMKPKPGAGGAPPSVRDRLMGDMGKAPAPPADNAPDLSQSAPGDYAEAEFKCPACGAQLCAKQSESMGDEALSPDDAGMGV